MKRRDLLKATAASIGLAVSPTFASNQLWLYAMIHTSGCGGRAFLLQRKPLPNDYLKSSDCRHINGSKIEPNSIVQCDTCGKNIRARIADIKFIGI